MNSITRITEAVAAIKDGSVIGIGGNVLHRAPMALIREIVRQNKKDLQVIKTAGAMDVDLLCYGGCVNTVDAGFISYETEFGLANHYRISVQKGIVKANEHACYSVICGLRAASYGVPFMPIKGLQTTDLFEVNDKFKKINDPFTSEEISVVKAMQPDVALLHVHYVDELGNAYIKGPAFEDVLLAKASRKVIVSTETITNNLNFTENVTVIPSFLIDEIVCVPKGTYPCACPQEYDINREDILFFKSLKSKDELDQYLKTLETIDYSSV